MSSTDLVVWGVVAHTVADWLLQNDWMAVNKMSLRHPAAWVHSSLHVAALLLVFSWPAALFLGVSHLLIDTRKPRDWWQTTIRQTRSGEVSLHVAFWVDQAMHIFCIAVAALIEGNRLG